MEASDAVGTEFDDLMIEVGVLGMVVLAAASLLVRRKEREPAEG